MTRTPPAILMDNMAVNTAPTRSTIPTGNTAAHTVTTAPIIHMPRIPRQYTTETQNGDLNHFPG